MAITSELSDLLQRKLASALAKVDSETESTIRQAWLPIGPNPKSPFVSETMGHIKKACSRGLVERDRVAQEVVSATILPFKDKLTSSVVVSLAFVIERAFPLDKFVGLVEGTPGVYQRSQAPTRKFDEHSYSLELALIKASSANSARQSVQRVRLALEEMALQREAAAVPWWRALCVVAKPAFVWVFGIIAAVATAALLKTLGLLS